MAFINDGSSSQAVADVSTLAATQRDIKPMLAAVVMTLASSH